MLLGLPIAKAWNASRSKGRALVKPTCSLGDGLVVGGETGTAGSLPAMTWVCRQAPLRAKKSGHAMRQEVKPRIQANRRRKNKDEPYRLLPRPNDP